MVATLERSRVLCWLWVVESMTGVLHRAIDPAVEVSSSSDDWKSLGRFSYILFQSIYSHLIFYHNLI